MSHTTIGNNELRCLHCGMAQAIAFPIGMGSLAGLMKGFNSDHARCKPKAAGAARFKWSTPDEWMASWDTGKSSIAIWNVMMGRLPAADSWPRDAADFGRCYRLVESFTGWRQRMVEMRSVTGWEKFVDNWERLSLFYEQVEFPEQFAACFKRCQP